MAFYQVQERRVFAYHPFSLCNFVDVSSADQNCVGGRREGGRGGRGRHFRGYDLKRERKRHKKKEGRFCLGRASRKRADGCMSRPFMSRRAYNRVHKNTSGRLWRKKRGSLKLTK